MFMEIESLTLDQQLKLKKATTIIEGELETFQKLMQFVDSFNKLDYTPERFFELKEICKVIFDNIPFMVSVIDGTIITRARRNAKVLFSRLEDISYNKNIDTIQVGRFNLKNESVFYGCLPTFHENGEFINYGNQCPMFEVCKEIGSHEGLTFPVFFTLGFWKVKKQLSVLNLCFEEDHLSSNAGIHNPIKSFSNLVKTHSSEKAFDFIRSVWEYFSFLSRKWDDASPPNYYYILTAFYTAFKEHYRTINGNECDGIIYPSAMTQAKGLNIVLIPTAVDQCLELSHVQMYTLRSRGLPYDYRPITQLVPVKDNYFEFDPAFVREYNIFNHSW
jgi:hypothetical protein